MTKKKVLILTITAFVFCASLTVINFSRIGKLFELSRNDKDEDLDGDADAVGEMTTLWQSRAYPDPTNMEEKYLAAWDRAREMKIEALNIRQDYGLNGTAGT